jgi:2-polyprenyl-3-methyl-5-hydroxy-6-metoxy-1,4-benzoquinol methylase
VKIHLIQALNKKFGISDISELSGIPLQHYTFASTTNERGEKSIEKFSRYGFSFKGLRILDVGCAYGGFAIAAAHLGASVYGVDINEKLLFYAEQNLLGIDELECKFIQVDATSINFLEKLPQDHFDLIIVNDVFEHVYDTVSLLSNLRHVGNSDATLYFNIPNGTNIKYALTEPHSGYLGLSLLPPHLWSLSGIKPRSIYYRPWKYYSAMYKQFGFNKINFTTFHNEPEPNTAEIIYNKYSEEKIKWQQQIKKMPILFRSHAQSAVDEYEKRMDYDIKFLDLRRLQFKYLTTFWCGFAHKGDKYINKDWQNHESNIFFDE